jgi:hypothetical protein
MVRSFYVLALVSEILSFFEITHIGMNTDHLLDGGKCGPVEFIFSGRNAARSPRAFIIETRQDNFDNGRAHLYMQLKALQEGNQDSKMVLFGAITNAEMWVFVRYDSGRFFETNKMLVQHPPEFDGLAKVVAMTASILDFQADAIEAIEDSEEEANEDDGRVAENDVSSSSESDIFDEY